MNGAIVGTGATFTSEMGEELVGDWSVKTSVCLGSHWAEQMFSVSMTTREIVVTEPDQMVRTWCSICLYGPATYLRYDLLSKMAYLSIKNNPVIHFLVLQGVR